MLRQIKMNQPIIGTKDKIQMDKIGLDKISILVKVNNNKFTIYTNDKKIIGEFSIYQLLKYIVVSQTESKTFLSNIDYIEAINIINKYVCIVNDKNIKLLTYNESPFMGDINLLLRMLNGIYNFKEHEGLTDNESEKNVIINFIIILSQYCLELIYDIIKIMDKDNGNNMKEKLTMYSVIIINKVNNIILNKMNNEKAAINLLNKKIDEVKNTKQLLMEKINDINNGIIDQTTKFNIIIDKISNIHDDIELYDNSEEISNNSYTNSNNST